MKYTRYLLCCLVLYLSSVPRPGESTDDAANNGAVNEDTSPLPPSGAVSTLLSLKNLLIFVAVALVLVAGLLLYRYCRSARKKGVRMRYTRLKGRAGGELGPVGEDDQDDQDEEETVYDKP